jgi:hypothetical protein
MEQPSATADDADPPLCDARLRVREPAGEEVQAPLLLPALGGAGIATDSAGAAADRGGQARSQTPDRAPQARPLVQQIAVGAIPLVLAGAGEHPRPTAGTGSRQPPLPTSPVGVAAAEGAALGQVTTGQASEVLANLAQHRLVGGRGPQPRADAGTRRGRDHKRCGDGANPVRHRGIRSCVEAVPEHYSRTQVRRLGFHRSHPAVAGNADQPDRPVSRLLRSWCESSRTCGGVVSAHIWESTDAA